MSRLCVDMSAHDQTVKGVLDVTTCLHDVSSLSDGSSLVMARLCLVMSADVLTVKADFLGVSSCQ